MSEKNNKLKIHTYKMYYTLMLSKCKNFFAYTFADVELSKEYKPLYGDE